MPCRKTSPPTRIESNGSHGKAHEYRPRPPASIMTTEQHIDRIGKLNRTASPMAAGLLELAPSLNLSGDEYIGIDDMSKQVALPYGCSFAL